MGADDDGGIRRILLVENDFLQAMEAAEVLKAAGYSVLGPAATLEQAFGVAKAAPGIDAAILDIRLNEESVYPLADWLRERGIPFAFVTGYQFERVIPDRFSDCALLEKPWHPAALIALAARLIGPRSGD